ncbi:MAG: hypothetical protein LAP38_13635 [Acidobacteriia bacterium]|nr:hypothetical protein [Terriglobia bacterium]
MALSRSHVLSGAALLVLAGVSQAQPVIYPNNIYNAGSYTRPNLPGGSIARGSVFAIFGKGIGPANGVLVSAFPLQPSLAGVGSRKAPTR